MLSKSFTTAAVVAVAAGFASAQTHTDCNPLEKSCPADPAFSKSVTCSFASDGACDAFEELDGTDLTYSDKGAVFTIGKEGGAPTVRSPKYIFFGRVDFEVQAAPGKGIVTSAVLQSDDLDEIDWEWVGSDNFHVQSNYFSKGDDSTYNRGGMHEVASPTSQVHTYSIEWTPESLQWIVDGTTVRTLTASEASGGKTYPQTPMQIKLGSWVAGCADCAKGTAEWAGGYTDFSQAPFLAYYKSVAITDYAGGSSAPEGAIKEYIYGDHSGSHESIDVVKADGSSDDDNSTTTAKDTATKTGKSSATKTDDATKTDGATTEDSTATTTKKSHTTGTATGAKNTTLTTMAPTTTGGDNSGTQTTGAPAITTTGTAAAPRNAAFFGGAAIAAVLAAAQLF